VKCYHCAARSSEDCNDPFSASSSISTCTGAICYKAKYVHKGKHVGVIRLSYSSDLSSVIATAFGLRVEVRDIQGGRPMTLPLLYIRPPFWLSQRYV